MHKDSLPQPLLFYITCLSFSQKLGDVRKGKKKNKLKKKKNKETIRTYMYDTYVENIQQEILNKYVKGPN